MRILFVLLLCCVSVVDGYALTRDPLAVDLPELETPPGASWFWAGRRMALNNVPMSVKVFQSSKSADVVTQFYLSKWKTAGHGKLTQKSIGNMTVLGFELDGVHYSVQFRPSGAGIEGKVVVTPSPLNQQPNKRSRLPIAPRSKVISKVESLDEGRRSETLTVDSTLGASQLYDYYRTTLQNDGWTQYSGNGERSGGMVAGFQRGGELLQLTIKQLQGRNGSFSQVLLHWLK